MGGIGSRQRSALSRLTYQHAHPRGRNRTSSLASTSLIHFAILVFTARRYAERGYAYATMSTVSVYLFCSSMKFRYRDHTGWNTSKITSRLNSLTSVINIGDLIQREHPQN